jgi:dTDP-glucose 4,6-dehydratase
MTKIMVTGGCGFIGSNFLNLFVRRYPDSDFVNVDKLTYAGNPFSTEALADAANYSFEHVDICDEAAMDAVFAKHDPSWVIHFAAESHVDRSIHGPRDFLSTNVMGTLNLLEACRAHWPSFVYGSLGAEGSFKETTPYDPSSPYSASKASSDHLVRSYHRTYGLPVKVTNCSNNYGPYQFPEKLIPLMTLNAIDGKPLPVYGKGDNVRDWLFVEDHCEAIWQVAEKGALGDTYNIGGRAERANLDIVRLICEQVAKLVGKAPDELLSLITFVKDRPGHDFRYAMDTTRIETELGWRPREDFESGMTKTVRWYTENTAWVEKVRTGEYKKWLETNYGQRSQP